MHRDGRPEHGGGLDTAAVGRSSPDINPKHDEPGHVGRLMLAHSASGFIAVSKTGVITACWGNAEHILGRAAGALVGRDLRQLPFLGDIAARLHEKGLARQGAVRFFDDESGEGALEGPGTVDVEWLPDSESAGGLLVLHPRGQSAALAPPRNRKNAMMANLSAALAHEIRNPLSGIRAAAQLAARTLPSEKMHLTEMIVNEADRLSGLVDQLEGLTDKEGRPNAPTNLHEVVDHVCTLLDGDLAATTHLQLMFDPSLPAVLADRDGLVQILLNLIINAQEAAAGADVIIRLRTRYHQGFHVAANAGGAASLPLELEVCDTGPGVAPHLEPDLFDPFVTSKEAGRGLGLAVVAFLAESMGAHLRYERAEPTGARFLLNFARA